jgi:4-amino-4-deoxy-L-arabinose transferase
MTPGKPRRDLLLLGLVLAASFALRLYHLDHDALTRFDESFHAVVAQNLLKHPLEPTLVDTPYLPYDYRDWTANHVWLHKGILPLWQIASSFAVFGVNALALRLPSLFLATGSVWLTYLIGRRLFDRRSALIAAALQAFNPALTMLVHGYWFSDHIDTALIFWVELGIYFLIRAQRTGRWRFVVLAGVAQGLAFLCKYYLAAIIMGLALTAWLLPVVRLCPPGRSKLRLRHVAGLLLVTLATIAPWTLWCLSQYPAEFRQELLHAGRHFGASIEGWGAPWDRLVFDYLIQIYRDFYTPVLIALLVVAGQAIRRRHTGSWLAIAWALGVVIPHLLAESKTPSATALAIPAFFLLFGRLVSEAWGGRRTALTAWTGIMVATVLCPAVIHPPGEGYPDPPVFAAIMRQSLWVVWHVVGTLAFMVLVEVVARYRRPLHRALRPLFDLNMRKVALTAATLATILAALKTAAIVQAVVTGRLTELGGQTFTEVGDFARRQLPRNAVLIVNEELRAERWLLAFRSDRVCYPLRPDDPTAGAPDGGQPVPRWLQDAHAIAASGGVPYLVAPRRLPLPVVFSSPADHRVIYACPP